MLVRLGAVWALVVGAAGGASAQQVTENCTVSVLNRTVTANPDGTWILPNVPANFGPVRARVTCIVNGQTISGESEPFEVPANGAVNIPRIIFGQTTPIPTALTVQTPAAVLTQTGATAQLAVTARYSDGSTRDVTNDGTSYTISNPAIATVTSGGLVAAVTSGTVLIQATHEGASGISSIQVRLGGTDTDGDGIPDDVELALGLNPNNAVDAMEDFDRDGLSNLQETQAGTDLRNADTDADGLKDGDEVARGTSPLIWDTDGDGISDGLEVQTGSNPLDPTSVNLPAALDSIAITPSVFTLTFNTIAGDVSVQLTVTGTLRDGRTIDLTSTQRGTNYTSSNLTICSFGGASGRVFAGTAGSCTITATLGAFKATATGSVTTFAPTALSSVDLGGPGNGVDVGGDYVYVAAGNAGLKVVDASSRSAPHVVATLSMLGSANDVKIAGARAFVAAGVAGLHIVDVSNPLLPRQVGSVDTPGDALDVAVRGNVAYVADVPAGLQVVDVSNPTLPRIVGSVPAIGGANGVDVDGTIAVVTMGGAGLQIVNVANPSQPVVVAVIDTPGDARDVVANGGFAYVADFTGSLRVVDFTNPSAPVLRGTTPTSLGGILLDVARMDTFAFGADIFFVNGVPIVDVSDPNNLRPRAILNFPGDATGLGIAVDGSHVYLGTDTNRLYIGQYRIQQDLNGVPPVVSIVSPVNGDTFVEGETIAIAVAAGDDLGVARVDLVSGGSPVATDTTAPYQFNVTVPTGSSSLTLGATATDFGNNTAAATDVTVNVIPDPLTTVAGRVVTRDMLLTASDNFNRADGQPGNGWSTWGNCATISANQLRTCGQPNVAGGIARTLAATFPLMFSFDFRTEAPDDGGWMIVFNAATPGSTPDVQFSLGQYSGSRPLFYVYRTSTGHEFISVPLPAGAQNYQSAGSAHISGIVNADFSSTVIITYANGSTVEAFTPALPSNAILTPAGAILTLGNSNATFGPHYFDNFVLLTLGPAVAAPGAAVDCHGQTGLTGADGTFALAGVPTIQPSVGCTASLVTSGGTVLRGSSRRIPPVRGGTTSVGDITIAPVPVVISIAPKVIDATKPPATIHITGANLSGASFSFVPALQPPPLTAGAPLVDVSGTTATVPITVSANARGRFTMVGANSFGPGDPTPTSGNTLTLINLLDDADSDGDGFPDGLELMYGSDPSNAASTPTLTAVGDVTSAQVAVVNTKSTETFQSALSAAVSIANTFLPAGAAQSAVSSAVSIVNTLLTPGTQSATSGAVSIANTALPQQTSQSTISPAVSVANSALSSSLQESRSAAVSVRNDSTAPLTQEMLDSLPIVPVGNPRAPTALALSLGIDGLGASQPLVEGRTINVRADVREADGNVSVAFTVNGVAFTVDSREPYVMTFTVPSGVPSLTFAASVRDATGETAAATPMTVAVERDPRTTVTGHVVDSAGSPVRGAVVELLSQGLHAEFFDSASPLSALPDLSGATPVRTTRVTAINMRGPSGMFGVDPFGVNLAPDYAARFTGWISIPTAGAYSFFLGADEGARLRLNGTMVIEMPAPVGGFQEKSASVSLAAGLVPIEVTFYESVGNAQLQLSFAPPDSERQIVVPSSLTPTSSARFLATTDDAGRFVLSGVPTALDVIQIRATVTQNGQVATVESLRVSPVSKDQIEIGDIVIPVRQENRR
jgi:hypothetical protein